MGCKLLTGSLLLFLLAGAGRVSGQSVDDSTLGYNDSFPKIPAGRGPVYAARVQHLAERCAARGRPAVDEIVTTVWGIRIRARRRRLGCEPDEAGAGGGEYGGVDLSGG